VKKPTLKTSLKRNKQQNKVSWLIFFYSVPSKPAGNRVKIWRRLAQIGAIQLKGSVYILPYNELNYEFFQWLVNEVEGMNGEAAFLKGEKVETLKEKDLIGLFIEQSEKDYRIVDRKLEALERIINNYKKGTEAHSKKRLLWQFLKLSKDFEEARKRDFFISKAGDILKDKMEVTDIDIKNLSVFKHEKEALVAVKAQNPKHYRGKIWVTRKKPFIDRIASAWLIKEFIDKKAVFKFIDEKDLNNLKWDAITFDIRDGNFTHIGDMCTFEVLLKSFRIKDKTLKKIAEIVHELDLKDDKYSSYESKGIEEILIGIRKTLKDDMEILEKGIDIFRMLYVSKT
jgi:hypothetical protein